MIRKIIQQDRAVLTEQRTDAHIYHIYNLFIWTESERHSFTNAREKITAKRTLRGYRRIETFIFFLFSIFWVIKEYREKK